MKPTDTLHLSLSFLFFINDFVFGFWFLVFGFGFGCRPPPALREAQSRFKDVVEAVVELATRQIEAQRLKEKFVKQME